MPKFSHLHVHTQFSLLDGAASIKELVKKAAEDGMPAVALTDHGNMFGAFQFVEEANRAGVKPIVGCEFYVVADRHKRSFTGGERDVRYHQLMLAKNQEGYKNLSKLCSLGYIEGLYSKFPRIDKALILQYKEGLIATTCCIGAEVPQAILRKGEKEAEQIFKWWLDVFGEDYYVELQRHNLKDIDGTGLDQEDVNQILLKWAKKYNVKVIATNDSHYVDEEDANAHDILLCVNTGDKQATPVGEGKGYRFGFPNNQFFFKSQGQMEHLFSDVPQALDFTNEIADKVTAPELKRDILMPNYVLPEGFQSQDDYLYHLAIEGVRSRYGEVSAEIQERLDYEMGIIKKMGFSGYFLITQDFTNAARKFGVSVGPGRGSAAGSLIAYATGITNIDPIRYKLLFERFLNPERVSMPDVDIDFDDFGRAKVIDYVVDKYGKNQVAHIITYGTMAAKMSIRDVARVLDMPLPDVDRLAKLVPSASLDEVFNGEEKALAKRLPAEQMEDVKKLREVIKGNDISSNTLRQAAKLEGSVRNTGIHAAGIIIAPEDITNYIPVCTSKESDLLVTQFDGKVVENAGMLKMDFLGLKTLTIIKDAVALIKEKHGVEIDIEKIPLDDEKTFELYQRGDTIGTFQFESPGMQKHLRELKPTNIEDLIAMNALYRPGPMQFIELYIQRKHGQLAVEYPHELLEPILEDTYGIMVYQEQIMQAAQVLAGYSLGQADLLRRAMGKKKMDIMKAERINFIDGAAKKNNISKEVASEIFDIMMRFAQYGFNRSHSAAYSVLAFQTGYLKANYPAEYMAAVLTNNMNDIKKITFFMEDCRRLAIPVLGPDVNESDYKFTVNAEGKIRFGMGAVKGAGEGAVASIVAERKENGSFKDIFDFAKRVDFSSVNKRVVESLVLAGAYDSFENSHRAQYFHHDPKDNYVFFEKVLKMGQEVQHRKNNAQQSLFGGGNNEDIEPPKMPNCEKWGTLEKLSKEKEVIGIYISGHPLDDYRFEIKHFCNADLQVLSDMATIKGRELNLGGIVSQVAHRISKRGTPFGTFTLEDYTDSFQFFLFGDDYVKFKEYLNEGWFLYITGKVQTRKWDDQQLEFKISKIDLLSEIKDKLAQHITIKLQLSQITDELVEELQQLMTSSDGNCKVKLSVEDQKIKVDLPSKRGGVKITDEFIHKLEEIRQVEYALNGQ